MVRISSKKQSSKNSNIPPPKMNNIPPPKMNNIPPPKMNNIPPPKMNNIPPPKNVLSAMQPTITSSIVNGFFQGIGLGLGKSMINSVMNSNVNTTEIKAETKNNCDDLRTIIDKCNNRNDFGENGNNDICLGIDKLYCECVSNGK
jgi:hypothetical protein